MTVDGMLADEHKQRAVSEITALTENQTLPLETSKFTSYVNFPPPQKNIATCRSVVESFGKAIADIFPDAVRRWNVESLLDEVTEAEIESIRDADAFCKASSSLFSLLHGCITCEAEHIATLHLSGFHTRQMEMLLGTGEHDWIPARFAS
jgi:hypothetical protein